MDQPQQSGPEAAAAQPSDTRKGSHRPDRMPGVHLQVQLGSALSMRFLCVQQRYEGKVVGLEPFTYLIVQARVPQDTLTRMAQDAGLVVQLHTEGVLFGFRTEVVNHVSTPASLFFLNFPSQVERVVLRRDERVRVSLPGLLHGAFGDQEVIITDLTPAGCALSAAVSLKSPLRTARPADRVVLHCELGSGQPLVLPMALRRVEEGKGRLTLGGQFLDLPADQAKAISDYVQRMLRFVRE